jgi:hypothetical protein
VSSTERFADAEDEVAFVSTGSGAVPSFGGRLAPGPIRHVVECTRAFERVP